MQITIAAMLHANKLRQAREEELVGALHAEMEGLHVNAG